VAHSVYYYYGVESAATVAATVIGHHVRVEESITLASCVLSAASKICLPSYKAVGATHGTQHQRVAFNRLGPLIKPEATAQTRGVCPRARTVVTMAKANRGKPKAANPRGSLFDRPSMLFPFLPQASPQA
jgi:NDP-sugar pyrophosphorylase family protein